MLLIETNVIVGPDRVVTLRLPSTVPVGRQRLEVRLPDARPGRRDAEAVDDAVSYDYDAAQAAAFEAVYRPN